MLLVSVLIVDVVSFMPRLGKRRLLLMVQQKNFSGRLAVTTSRVGIAARCWIIWCPPFDIKSLFNSTLLVVTVGFILFRPNVNFMIARSITPRSTCIHAHPREHPLKQTSSFPCHFNEKCIKETFGSPHPC